MIRFNSSTSDFKFSLPEVRAVLRVSLYMLVWFILLDLGVSLAVPYSTGADGFPTGKLTRYFNYGRSSEAKIAPLIGAVDESTSSIGLAGWLETDRFPKPIEGALRSERTYVTMYGMSFVRRLGRALDELDPAIQRRFIGGPGAPPNHAYSAFLMDRDQDRSQIVVIGIAAQSLPQMTTLTGATWSFEGAYPYTYPSYRLVDGQLQATRPVIETLDDMRSALTDDELWARWEDQLAEFDSYYDPFLFNHNWLDSSAALRLTRRAWSQHKAKRISKRLLTKKGFDPASEELEVLRAMCVSFAQIAREDGRIPIVLLFNNLDYEDYLYQALHETLDAHDIAYLSTHEIAPATDYQNFLPDGHFTPEVDRALAQELLRIIEPLRAHSEDP